MRRKLSARMRARGRLATAVRFERQAASAAESALVIHKVLLHGPSTGTADGGAEPGAVEPASDVVETE